MQEISQGLGEIKIREIASLKGNIITAKNQVYYIGIREYLSSGSITSFLGHLRLSESFNLSAVKLRLTIPTNIYDIEIDLLEFFFF